jgi:hypothetical protein
MSITKAFRKINESGYVVNSALMWSRIDLREALGVAGYNDLEIAKLSELEQDDMRHDRIFVQHEDGNFYNVWATYEDYQLSDNKVITLEVSGMIHCEDVEDLHLSSDKTYTQSTIGYTKTLLMSFISGTKTR